MAMYHHIHEPGNLDDTMNRCFAAVKGLDFKTIVCTGQSGIVPASVLAWKLNKGLVIIRKVDEPSHGLEMEGKLVAPYIWLDDFPDSGATLARLRLHAPTPIAAVLYGMFSESRKLHNHGMMLDRRTTTRPHLYKVKPLAEPIGDPTEPA